MHIPKKETLDTVLDYRFKPQDNETSEKVKRLYDIIVSGCLQKQ
jgi:hypothetical protein